MRLNGYHLLKKQILYYKYQNIDNYRTTFFVKQMQISKRGTSDISNIRRTANVLLAFKNPFDTLFEDPHVRAQR